MTQEERRIYLITSLLSERQEYKSIVIPGNERGQKDLLRSLMNVRMPGPVTEEYIKIEREYLTREIAEKKITDIENLTPIKPDIYLWQGDITTLRCDAIVNAANSGMLGCFQPLHNCIDNCIHTFAGLQLRNYCNDIMEKQGFEEPTGKAKITPAFNLPCRYVIHTVGPIVSGGLKKSHEELLASCYISCLKAAQAADLKSIAFCCISTGVFGFPQKRAAEIATKTVADYKKQTGSKIKVIFNVFKSTDLDIYIKVINEG